MYRVLPSDVARLFLAYLHDKKYVGTMQKFIEECPHLAELRGKDEYPVLLPLARDIETILEEHAMLTEKAKKECQRGPDVMWKKLDGMIAQLKYKYMKPSDSPNEPESRSLGQAARTKSALNKLEAERARQKRRERVKRRKKQPPGCPPLQPIAVSTAMTPDPSPDNPTTDNPNTDNPPVDYVSEGPPVLSPPHSTPSKESISMPSASTSAESVPLRLQSVSTTPRRKRATPKKKSSSSEVEPLPSPPSGSRINPEELAEFPEILEVLMSDKELTERLAGTITKALPIVASNNTAREEAGPSEIPPEVDPQTVEEAIDMTSADPAFDALFSLFNVNREKFREDEQRRSFKKKRRKTQRGYLGTGVATRSLFSDQAEGNSEGEMVVDEDGSPLTPWTPTDTMDVIVVSDDVEASNNGPASRNSGATSAVEAGESSSRLDPPGTLLGSGELPEGISDQDSRDSVWSLEQGSQGSAPSSTEKKRVRRRRDWSKVKAGTRRSQRLTSKMAPGTGQDGVAPPAHGRTATTTLASTTQAMDSSTSVLHRALTAANVPSATLMITSTIGSPAPTVTSCRSNIGSPVQTVQSVGYPASHLGTRTVATLEPPVPVRHQALTAVTMATVGPPTLEPATSTIGSPARTVANVGSSAPNMVSPVIPILHPAVTTGVVSSVAPLTLESAVSAIRSPAPSTTTSCRSNVGSPAPTIGPPTPTVGSPAAPNSGSSRAELQPVDPPGLPDCSHSMEYSRQLLAIAKCAKEKSLPDEYSKRLIASLSSTEGLSPVGLNVSVRTASPDPSTCRSIPATSTLVRVECGTAAITASASTMSRQVCPTEQNPQLSTVTRLPSDDVASVNTSVAVSRSSEKAGEIRQAGSKPKQTLPKQAKRKNTPGTRTAGKGKLSACPQASGVSAVIRPRYVQIAPKGASAPHTEQTNSGRNSAQTVVLASPEYGSLQPVLCQDSALQLASSSASPSNAQLVMRQAVDGLLSLCQAQPAPGEHQTWIQAVPVSQGVGEPYFINSATGGDPSTAAHVSSVAPLVSQYSLTVPAGGCAQPAGVPATTAITWASHSNPASAPLDFQGDLMTLASPAGRSTPNPTEVEISEPSDRGTLEALKNSTGDANMDQIMALSSSIQRTLDANEAVLQSAADPSKDVRDSGEHNQLNLDHQAVATLMDDDLERSLQDVSTQDIEFIIKAITKTPQKERPALTQHSPLAHAIAKKYNLINIPEENMTAETGPSQSLPNGGENRCVRKVFSEGDPADNEQSNLQSNSGLENGAKRTPNKVAKSNGKVKKPSGSKGKKRKTKYVIDSEKQRKLERRMRTCMKPGSKGTGKNISNQGTTQGEEGTCTVAGGTAGKRQDDGLVETEKGNPKHGHETGNQPCEEGDSSRAELDEAVAEIEHNLDSRDLDSREGDVTPEGETGGRNVGRQGSKDNDENQQGGTSEKSVNGSSEGKDGGKQTAAFSPLRRKPRDVVDLPSPNNLMKVRQSPRLRLKKMKVDAVKTQNATDSEIVDVAGSPDKKTSNGQDAGTNQTTSKRSSKGKRKLEKGSPLPEGREGRNPSPLTSRKGDQSVGQETSNEECHVPENEGRKKQDLVNTGSRKKKKMRQDAVRGKNTSSKKPNSKRKLEESIPLQEGHHSPPSTSRKKDLTSGQEASVGEVGEQGLRSEECNLQETEVEQGRGKRIVVNAESSDGKKREGQAAETGKSDPVESGPSEGHDSPPPTARLAGQRRTKETVVEEISTNGQRKSQPIDQSESVSNKGDKVDSEFNKRRKTQGEETMLSEADLYHISEQPSVLPRDENALTGVKQRQPGKELGHVPENDHALEVGPIERESDQESQTASASVSSSLSPSKQTKIQSSPEKIVEKILARPNPELSSQKPMVPSGDTPSEKECQNETTTKNQEGATSSAQDIRHSQGEVAHNDNSSSGQTAKENQRIGGTQEGVSPSSHDEELTLTGQGTQAPTKEDQEPGANTQGGGESDQAQSVDNGGIVEGSADLGGKASLQVPEVESLPGMSEGPDMPVAGGHKDSGVTASQEDTSAERSDVVENGTISSCARISHGNFTRRRSWGSKHFEHLTRQSCHSPRSFKAGDHIHITKSLLSSRKICWYQHFGDCMIPLHKVEKLAKAKLSPGTAHRKGARKPDHLQLSPCDASGKTSSGSQKSEQRKSARQILPNGEKTGISGVSLLLNAGGTSADSQGGRKGFEANYQEHCMDTRIDDMEEGPYKAKYLLNNGNSGGNHSKETTGGSPSKEHHLTGDCSVGSVGGCLTQSRKRSTTERNLPQKGYPGSGKSSLEKPKNATVGETSPVTLENDRPHSPILSGSYSGPCSNSKGSKERPVLTTGRHSYSEGSVGEQGTTVAGSVVNDQRPCGAGDGPVNRNGDSQPSEKLVSRAEEKDMPSESHADDSNKNSGEHGKKAVRNVNTSFGKDEARGSSNQKDGSTCAKKKSLDELLHPGGDNQRPSSTPNGADERRLPCHGTQPESRDKEESRQTQTVDRNHNSGGQKSDEVRAASIGSKQTPGQDGKPPSSQDDKEPLPGKKVKRRKRQRSGGINSSHGKEKRKKQRIATADIDLSSINLDAFLSKLHGTEKERR